MITDGVQISLITGSVSIVIASIPGLFAAFSAGAARRASERAEKLSHDTHLVTVATGKAVDGRMTEMLELTKKLAFAAGVLQQKQAGDAIAAAVKDAQTPTVVIAQPMRPEIERQEKDV